MNPLHLYAALALVIFTATQAQQPAVPAPAPPPVAPPGPDPKLIKEYESIMNQKFTRDPGELLRHLERVGTTDPATLPANDRFLMRFVTGDWAKIGEELKQMPPDLAVKIYNKMLADLTENRKPVVRLDDIVGLSEAAPAELNNDNVRRLGQLLGIAVPVNESFWLLDRFQKGTGKFGGADPAKRLLAARVLIAGNFRDLARTYLPGNDQIAQIADEGVRNELMAFVATQEQRENTQRSEVQRIWDENIRELLAPSTDKNRNSEKQKAISNISKIITQVPLSTLAPVFTELVKSNPETAMKLLTALERKVQNDRNGDVLTRTSNIAVQASVAALLCDLVKPGEQPWTQVIELMADVWASEAENTFTQKSATSNQQKFILPEDLMPHAPTGKWAAALNAGARDRMDVAMSRLILTGANFDQAAERIVEIGKRSARAGAALAEDFLGVWAKTHNPQIPEPLRRKFNLPDDARIPVTPIMMEKNIESLSRMMALFRQAGIAPADYSKVVDAFDLAYSSAETYRTTHIEKVFGPMDKMDEPLFFLILSRMSKNLGERWRKMDVQTAGMTQRDETQTLDLVREGYGTALKLIDGWIAGHGDSTRALTLAGTLLVEWGDFEYFQELVASDSKMRMTGYKEKNLQAQEYFNRGAVAYGTQVAQIAPGDYNVAAYLGWFNGLLGISSNGQINLSKAMNRAALTRIREHLVALPGKASKAHISMFAKIVNDRLADEKDPLHEDLKYRYLASSLVITKDDPFTLGAQKQVAYLDELLSEVRLQTRVDGPNTVGRDQDFGIIVSIVHTEAMGRAAHFGQYLTNDANAGLVKQQRKPSPLVKKMRAAQGPRDELELNITEALAPFFDIHSFTFATPEVKPRPTAQAGWDETILAYLHVRAKDASVDKIPPVQLELKFVDLSGPITIPAESAETAIKVATDKIEPRPANNIEITQTLDNRQLNINGGLTLEVKATASGLVPDIEQLLDLKSANTVAIKNINAHEGLQITELNTWADQVAPRSERIWTISLDGDQVRASEAPITFHFPQPKAKDAIVTYSSYTDMNLTTLKEPAVQIGREMTAQEVAIVASKSPYLWPAIIGGAGLLFASLLWLVLRGKGKTERPIRARDVFTMPKEVDGFAVVALLRRLCSSPLVKLKDTQQSELQSDLKRVEAACFGASAGALSETDLRAIASKWLRSAT
ncbi:MAG: hypothetical protein QE274_03350 [Verrucomicrobiaceae bacterium]|nr:hypothetical protein [Verrucomicrobiaceae bacterium]